jgi:hypothetical protein
VGDGDRTRIVEAKPRVPPAEELSNHRLVNLPFAEEQAEHAVAKQMLQRVEVNLRERHEPAGGRECERETRNRKPLSRPSNVGAAWELRCGPDNRG